MTRHLPLAALAILAGGVLADGAQAATLRLGDITSSWEAVTPSGRATASTTETSSTITWGTPYNNLNAPSGYDFTRAGPRDIVVDEEFDLGTFTHRNRTIIAGTSITAASLRLGVALDFDGTVFNLDPLYGFTHFETPNAANPCADGGALGAGVNAAGCADRVDIGDNAPSSAEFVAGGRTYVIEITGFQVGADLFSVFWTREQQDNSAILRARVTLAPAPPSSGPSPVPVPAAGWMLLAALVAGAAASRRRAR